MKKKVTRCYIIPTFINNIKYLTRSEVIEELGVTRQSLWRWRKAGLVPPGNCYRGRQVIFNEEDRTLIESCGLRVSPIQGEESRQLEPDLDEKNRLE